MRQSIIQRIAMLFPSSGSALTETDNFDDDQLNYLESVLPSGSGIDCGMQIDIENSTRNEVILTGDYHYMDEHGFYAGWFGFSVVIGCDLTCSAYVKEFSVSYNNTELEDDSITELFDEYLSETIGHVCFELKDVKRGESYPIFD